jgi:succinate dehydrogenase flavin-adding protein (antitoxin of CptAB toxin-antitoxin module)
MAVLCANNFRHYNKKFYKNQTQRTNLQLLLAQSSQQMVLWVSNHSATQANYGNRILDKSPAFKLTPVPPPPHQEYFLYELLSFDGV